MKTLRKLVYAEVLWAVLYVALGFLALFSFFDLVDELQSVQSNAQSSYKLHHALAVVALLMPSRLYELLPICVLIGSVLVMARMAQSSEFTILRTGGLGPGKALGIVAILGLILTSVTFVIGDYVAPSAERQAQLLKARRQGGINSGQNGNWLKEKQTDTHYAINIAVLTPEAEMRGVRIFEFDAQGRLVSLTQAQQAHIGDDDAWHLEMVERQDYPVGDRSGQNIEKTQHTQLRWPTHLSLEMVSVALLKPERMGTLELFRYIQHLNANGQVAQHYEIEFWRKVFYPLSCLVMVVLALPFAYLHFRSDGIAAYVFGGIMIGISFFLINNLFGYIGRLEQWPAWITAAAPGLLYSIGALSAFAWFVVRR